MNKKTNLFVVGAMKAGTTSFNEMLALHPAVYFSPVKEPHYFVDDLPSTMYSPSRFFDLDDYLNQEFPQALHIAHLKTSAQYEKIFSLAPEDVKYLAEGSTGYLHAPESAAKIHAYNPDAKIIILVREGLKRAYSHYKMNSGLGRETRSFSEAIQAEYLQANENGIDPWGYYGMSLYYDNIQRFKSLFGERVLVLNLSDFKKDKHAFLGQLFDFLAIENLDLDLPHSNASDEIKYKKLMKFIHDAGIKDLMSRILPKKVRHAMFNQIPRAKNESNEIEIPEEITAAFEKDFESIQSWIS